MPFWSSSNNVPQFDEVKLRANLKMGVARLRMVQSKRQNAVRIQRRHIADLLRMGKVDESRVKVESLIREDLSIAGLDILAIFIELVASRVQVIMEVRTCPPELKEAVTSVLWAVPRIENVPELHAVRLQFALKFGKQFCEMAANNDELSVNDRLLEKLNIVVPTPAVCVEYLEGIATEYNVPFDSAELHQSTCVVADVSAALPSMTGNGGGVVGRFVVPPIIVPRDDIEARLLALRRA
jgi:vacuolar protein sorting-associated protein IST1